MAVAYAEGVADGRIVACEYVRLAARRFLMLRADAMALKRGMFWSDASVIECCAFLERLPHVQGNWSTPCLVLDPWQCFLVAGIMGARWRDTGNRVVRRFYGELPRKSAKSTKMAGLALYCMCYDGESAPDCYIGAPKEQQADKVFEPMRLFTQHAEGLAERFGITSTTKKITVGATNGIVRKLSSVGKTEDGHNPHIIILDEMHAQRSDLVTVMKSSQRARPNGLLLMIGSGGRQAFGPGWDERQHAIRVLKGRREDHYFALIYTVDDGDERIWSDEKVIAKANPAFGASVDKRVVMQEARDARSSPAERAEFMRTVLNVWGRNAQALVPPEDWSRLAEPDLTIKSLRGMPTWIGADLAGRNDMSALGLLVHDEDDDVLYVFARHFLPDRGPWRDDPDFEPVFSAWAGEYGADEERTWLELLPGARSNYVRIESYIHELHEMFDVQGVAVDEWQANDMIGRLRADGVSPTVYPMRPRTLHEPTDDLVARVLDREKNSLVHDGNPVLAWNAQNVVSHLDANDNLFPRKATKGSSAKIDGFIALVMANGLRLGTLEKREERQPKEEVVVSEFRTFGDWLNDGR